jgi:ZIP family zinc transporter
MAVDTQTEGGGVLAGRSTVGFGAVAVLVALSVAALASATGTAGLTRRPELWKVVGIGWVAFFAMALAIPLGVRGAVRERVETLVWGYGLSSGAMITSAAVFLLPQAFVGIAASGGANPQIAGFGVGAGIVAGFGAHAIGHRLMHADVPFDHTAVELSAHALSAGVIIGLIYGNMPELGLVLGLAIVSHKGPAGYAAARRLSKADKPASVLLLPASGVGLGAIPAALVAVPNDPAIGAAVFGFAAGIFLHVAMDFLPSCEVGGEIYAVATADEHQHRLLDRMRLHAVASTVVGAAAVFVAWLYIV